MEPFGKKSLAILLVLTALSTANANPVLEQLQGKPIVFIGQLGHREAVVHEDSEFYYVVYFTKTAWGIQVLEVTQIHKESKEKATMYIDPQSCV
jgi:hypothetical protein